MTNAANGANANGDGRRRWLLYAEDSVTPELRGPYATEAERVEAARALLAAPGADAHAVFRLDAAGEVAVGVFGAREVE